MSTRTATAVKASLRKKLLRMASTNPDGSEKRAAALTALRKLGYNIKPKSASDPKKLLGRFAKGDKMPPELLEKFKSKDDDKGSGKEAGVGKTAIKKDTEDFIRWCLSTQAPMSPHEVETFVTRTLGVKTSPPRQKRTGPRFQRGDLVEIKFDKHKASNGNPGPYKLYNGKIGTVSEIAGEDALVTFKGEREPVRFEGAQKTRGVGIYKYTAPFTITGSAKIEMVYNAGGQATPDAQVVVEAYLGRGRGTEKRAANYYTGHVVSASTGSNGYYFMGFPQQRMEVGTEGGFRPRSFNPAKGEVIYIGVLNSRPSKWKAELDAMDKAMAPESEAA